MNKIAVAGVIVAVLAGAFALLAETRNTRSFARHFFVGLLLLGAFIGVGAVFGKTLGDFLRNVNGAR
jgi:hypothetical protein